MHTSFAITPIPTAPRDARHAFADALSVLPTPLAADVLLVASELITNVVRHTLSGQGDATIIVEPATVQVAVSDEDPHPVEILRGQPALVSATGRGLTIARALASQVTQTVRADGKTITAVFSRPDVYSPGY